MTEIFFGTNRNPTESQGQRDFGSELHGDGTLLRFGKAKIADDLGNVEKVDTAEERLDPPKGRQQLGSATIFRQIGRRMRRGIDTVLFIHGFNYTFAEALMDAARLKQTYYTASRNSCTFLVFSWPSDGTLYPLISYPRDRAYAEMSGRALGRGFLKLGDFVQELSAELGQRFRSDLERDSNLTLERKNLCAGRLHLIAHSMGAYALRQAVQGMRQTVGDDLPRLFDEVLLCAADEDTDAFEHTHKLALLPRLARRITVYHNREDIPLVISDLTKGNPDRLGADGPYCPQNLPGKISMVDCTDVVTAGFQEHRYHKEDGNVVRDIKDVLNGTASHRIKNRTYIPETNSYRLLSQAT